MKLIIDISEADWERYKKTKSEFGARESVAIQSIVNGTPLDDVKAEIQENIDYNKKMNYQGIVAGLLLALDIIDKYKAESEEDKVKDFLNQSLEDAIDCS